jgi:hypothetical protein
MDTQHQETSPPPNRPSFFGLPAGLSAWSQVGRPFWAGVLIGLGTGLLIAAALVEQELLTLHRKAWVSLTGAVLFGLGQVNLTILGRQARDLKSRSNAN